MRYQTTAALAALAALALACGSGDGDGDADAAGGDTAKAAKAATVGKAARDGKFEFTVTAKPNCSKTSVGPAQFGEKAQGVFCILPVTVKNIGKEAQMFAGSNQKAYDAKGVEYSNATAAEMHANEGNTTFLQDINPGNKVKGNLIFDVPKGTKLTKVELHDSAFSGGITVAL